MLTNQEQELIKYFRCLNPKTKDMVMVFMKGQARRDGGSRPRLTLVVGGATTIGALPLKVSGHS